MSKAAFIISYFGTGEKRETRKAAHREQLSFFKSKGYEITVCAMDYRDEDIEDGVSYIFSDVVPPGKARNKLLEAFYRSSYDWAVFADNDSWWKDEGKYNPTGKSIDDEIIERKIFEKVDAFGLMDGRVTAYNSILEANKNQIEFKINPQFRGCCFFLANIKKKRNIEVYFSDEFIRPDGSFIMGEDLGFALSLVDSGCTVFQCMNVVLQEKCVQASTWANSDSERKLFYEEMRAACERVVPSITRKPNGSLDVRKFYEHHKHPKSMIISTSIDLSSF